MNTPKQLVERVTSLRTASEVAELLEELEGLGYHWLPIGGRPNNEGTIDQSSDPAESLTERITNAIDAILEREWREHHLHEPKPGSPREAVERWFKIKQGRVSNIVQKTERRRVAEWIQVVLHESGVERSPTVSIMDKGIGQHPDDFWRTLLSLNEENKIDKHFLMGAYGQGGATVYAFAEYTILISRRVPSLLGTGQMDQVGWTIVRFNPLDDDHKKGTYEYLVGPEKKVLRFSPSLDVERYGPGTQVWMIQYQLPKHFTIFTAPSSSLWALTNMVLPDPVLPFLIGDQRVDTYKKLRKASTTQKTRPVLGSFNRLRQRSDTKALTDSDEDDTKVKILHHQEYQVKLGMYGEPVIRYWILGPSPDSTSAPVDAFTDSQSAIMLTINGQRHAKFDRSYFRLQLGLPILGTFMIIQIDGDTLSKAGKKALVSSNRTEIKKVELLDALLAEMNGIILKDPYVTDIANQLQEAALKSASSERNIRLSRQLEQLIKEWEMSDSRKVITEKGYRMMYDKNGQLTTLTLHHGEVLEEEDKDDDGDEQHPPKPPKVWVGKYFPTEFDFVIKREPLHIPLARQRGRGRRRDALLWVRPYTIWFETDGIDDCLTRDKDAGRLTLAGNPSNLINERTRSAMQNGRIFIRVVPTQTATPGAEVEIEATLTFPGRPALSARRRAVFVKPHPGKRKLTMVTGEPEYKMVPVTWEEDHWESDDKETGRRRIDLQGWTINKVAEVQPGTKGIVILINMSNPLYIEAIRNRKLSKDTIEKYSDKYKVAIAFHSYLQYRAVKAMAEAGKQTPSEDALDEELTRTVRTVIFTTFVAPEAEVLAAEPAA